MCSEFIKVISHINQYAEAASEEYDVAITFSDDAIDRILVKHPHGFAAVDSFCDEIISVFEYGLRLIGQKCDNCDLEITAEGVDDPEKFINDRVNAVFKLDD